MNFVDSQFLYDAIEVKMMALVVGFFIGNSSGHIFALRFLSHEMINWFVKCGQHFLNESESSTPLWFFFKNWSWSPVFCFRVFGAQMNMYSVDSVLYRISKIPHPKCVIS